MQNGLLSLQVQAINSKQCNISTLTYYIQLAFKQQDYVQASHYSQKLLKLLPQDSDTLLNFAYAELRQHHYKTAYKYYQLALQQHPRHFAEIYDGLTEVCYFLNKTEEQIHYGRSALNFKKQLVAQEVQYSLPSEHAPQFNAAKRLENIISYSLFGAEARYCETAIQNVKRAKILFPEWTCRFYLDSSVPTSIVTKLKLLGAQVVHVNEQQQRISGLFWRFFVMDDPQVQRFLIRDADSILSYREQATVVAWIKSKKWFHTLCDAYSHTELILAGLWGGCRGVFTNVQENIEQFIATHSKEKHRTLDQLYLRQRIYPTLKQSVLIHDSQFYHPASLEFPTYDKRFPEEHKTIFHVGQNDAIYFINLQIAQPNVQHLTWLIFNEDGYEVCRYTQIVMKGQTEIRIAIPSSYAQALEQKKWQLFQYT